MKVDHSTLAPLLGSNVIVCHNLFEGEGKLTYSPAFGKYFIHFGHFGESATIGFKIGNVKRVTVTGDNKDIYLQGADFLD